MDHNTISRFITITDVEECVDNILGSEPLDTVARRLQLSASEISFFTYSNVLRKLLVWKQLYRLREDVDRFYSDQSQHNRAAPPDNQSPLHLEAFEKAFKDINDACGRPFGRGRINYFLDMGFAPGGFSTWLLRTNPDANGVGITLSPEASRIWSQVDPQFRPRFQENHGDIRRLAAGDISISQCHRLSLMLWAYLVVQMSRSGALISSLRMCRSC